MSVSPPRRLLVVSANIGEGHNATARAVEERARRLWPGCQIRRVDTLEEMGRWVGPGFRWIYRVNVDTTPWLYDFFYRALWRYRWFAAASCRVVGIWSGMRLARIIDEYQPDLVISTYPLGTGGLDWIRRRGGLDVPVVAIISDFAPHPFWVYPEIDLHYVASEPSLRAMYAARPDARGAVGAPPVVSAFQPGSKTAARRACELPEHGLIVLISCGSFGFGSVERAVDAALAADPQLCVVVACGRNEALRARLAARGQPPQRLVPLGWTPQMPALTAAADVVVTNAGGATALEAVACGRAVLMFEPIAGHGKANAEVMARSGLAQLCRTPGELTEALRLLVRDPTWLACAEQRALGHISTLDLDADLAALPQLPRHRGARRLCPLDAFFVHAATPTVPQHVGAILLLDERAGGDPEVLARHLHALITSRVPRLPLLNRRLQLRPGRAPCWLPPGPLDPAQHVSARSVGTGHGGSWPQAVQEFFTTPVPLAGPPWQLQVVHDADAGRTALLAKLHHSLGDGLAVTSTLIELLSDAAGVPRDGGRVRVPEPLPSPPLRRVLRGLASLLAAGFPPPGGPAGRSTPGREFALVELPGRTVRAAARTHGVSTTALLLALVGEAAQRSGLASNASTGRLRAMVPRTTHALRRASSEAGEQRDWDAYCGNRTAAVAIDLPVGPMPLAWRVVAVAAELDRQERAHQPVAAQAVLRALGTLPAPLHAGLVRSIYRRRFFTLIASVLPGPRRAQYMRGARVVSVFPLLPLAEGVGLAVGFLTWADMVGVGVTTDSGLLPGADRFAEALRCAFFDLTTDTPDARAVQE